MAHLQPRLPPAARAQVANHALALHLDAAQDSVEVAIGGGRDHPQPVARGLPFGPKLVSRAAEEGNVAGLQGGLVRRTVHEAQHQHFTVDGILYDGRRQPTHFVEVNFHSHFRHSFRAKTKPR